MKVHNRILLCGASVFLCIGYTFPCKAQMPTPSKDALTVNFELSSKFRERATLVWKGRSLKQCLESLSQQCDTVLQVDDRLSERRVTAILTRLPIHRALKTLEAAEKLHWEKRTDSAGSPYYQLTQTAFQRKAEQAEIQKSVDLQNRIKELKKSILLSAIKAAIAHANEGKSATAQMLSGLSDQQVSHLLDNAMEPVGAIPSNDNSHLHDHTLFSTPYSTLSPETQGALQGGLQKPEFTGDGTNGAHYALPTNEENSLQDSYISLIATDSGVSLGVVDRQGKDVWMSPSDTVSRQGIPGVDRGDEADIELVQALAELSDPLLEGFTPEALHKTLRAPSDLDRTHLSGILDWLAKATGFSALSDDFIRSHKTIYSQILTDKDEYTLEEALLQIAKAFGHRIVLKQGVMLFTTLTKGADLRIEPSAAVWNLLVNLHEKGLTPTFQEYLLLTSMTREQIDTLQISGPSEIAASRMLMRLKRAYRVLHFYALLTQKQRDMAEATGLRVKDLPNNVRAEFEALAETGLVYAQSSSSRKEAGFYAKRKEGNPLSDWSFIAVPQSRNMQPVLYSLPVLHSP